MERYRDRERRLDTQRERETERMEAKGEGAEENGARE
jgi:hypothetical protein